MPVAEGQQLPRPLPPEAGLRPLLGIELLHLEVAVGDVGQERDVVLPLHGVLQVHIEFVLHIFHHDPVSALRRLLLQHGQTDAAAGESALAHGVDHIAADGADGKDAPLHVGGDIAVHRYLSGEQFRHGHAQGVAQRRENGNVGQTPARFP